MKSLFLTLTAAFVTAASLLAAPPVVKTVPWVASSPLVPHDTWNGKSITLKGTSDQQGAAIQYSWDFGDGSPLATGTVTNQYIVQASHSYTGISDQVFTATLTITNTGTGESASKQYYVSTRTRTLPVEVNVAIDEGLWYLHKNQVKSGAYGYWSSSYIAAQSAANVNAFEVNGHVESGDPSNPYTETVARGLGYLFTYLVRVNIAAAHGDNPDSNGNGFGLRSSQYPEGYITGHLMDAIIASGTPNALAPTGPADVIGEEKYKDIIQDMVDWYAFAQYDGAITADGITGGWIYQANNGTDNSVNQWASIGMIPAERAFGCTVPAWVKTYNVNSLNYTKNANGVYGYTSSGTIWGPYATTPSGLVQCALNGIGRGNPLWDHTETFLRDNFANAISGGPVNSIKRNYYGLFSFTKAMLLHDSNADLVAEPIQFLHSATAGVSDIDWYSAQAAPNGTDPTDGVARQLISDQLADGSWNTSAYNYTGDQTPQNTAYAIIMLQRTIFSAGAPVAVAKADPNPAVAFQTVQLDGSASFHQDSSKLITTWEWDLDNNGTFETSGAFPTVSFPAVGNYPVTLRVKDNGTPQASATTTLTIVVSTPPLAPTANAGGPYNLCPGAKPWFLNGTGSTNPDDGQHQAGAFPGDFITSYQWDLSGNGLFTDASGPTPDVTAFFSAKPPGDYLIQLKVTDNTALSFPASGQPNLSGTATATVHVRATTDLTCACVSNLAGRGKPGKIQLTWTNAGAHHYNVYRGTVSGGPYAKIGSTTSTYSTYLDLSVVNGQLYFYVVREANALDQEQCQSNQAAAQAPMPR